LSHVVIYFNSTSTSSAAVAVTAFKPVPGLVDDLLSFALLTGALLYSLV